MQLSPAARIAFLATATVAWPGGAVRAQPARGSWLDAPTIRSWNTPGLSIPAAPPGQGVVDPRCRAPARPPASEEDARVRERGWDLIGAAQGARNLAVIRGTASYDGMCRPRVYQAFVFARGVFVGTLSPDTMDSRTDGALGRVVVRSDGRLTAEYARYAAKDPLCCPSRTTRVEFELADDGPVVRAVAKTTSVNQPRNGA